MASILKPGDSYSVHYKYKDHSGKPCEGWESFKTKKEAQERKITVEKELLDGTFLVPDTPHRFSVHASILQKIHTEQTRRIQTFSAQRH